MKLIEYALYFSIGVIVLTAISHASIVRVINMVGDAATNDPKRLRGVTAEQALAKVKQWENTRDRLWPLAWKVVGGAIALAIVLTVLGGAVASKA